VHDGFTSMNLPQDPPLNLREACRIPAYATALSNLVDRVGERDVTEDLVESGLDVETARRVVKDSKKLLDDARSGPGNLLIGTGAFFLIAGTVVTAFTVITALDSGGFYVIWYGAILWGMISIVRGLSMNRAPDLGAVRDRVDEAIEAARQTGESAAAGGAGGGEDRRTYDY
jgi:hypothetical protein